MCDDETVTESIIYIYITVRHLGRRMGKTGAGASDLPCENGGCEIVCECKWMIINGGTSPETFYQAFKNRTYCPRVD